LNAPAPNYAFWQNALAGRPQPVHDGDPQPGFYYQRRKDGPRLPVAIWFSDAGDPLALVGFDGTAKLGNAAEIWSWVCQYPVTEEIYRAAFAAGAWPDDPPPARGSVPGDNLPADPAEAMRLELEAELENAKDFLNARIDTQADADKAAVWARRVGELSTKADEARKEEKEPHLTASRAVDDKWRPIVEGAKELSRLLKKHLEGFLLRQREAEAARRREQEAEAQRLREAAATAFESGSPNAETIGTALAKQADIAETVAALPPQAGRAGRTGARVALRTVYVAVITDFDACYAALKAHPDMKDFVQQLADRACRAKVPLAGVEFRPEQKAV
jgi:hypothetical protein